MTRPIAQFLRYLAGLRVAHSNLTAPEREILWRLSNGARSVVEVGVYEGATSAILAQAIAPEGTLWLVDPFFRHTRPEKWLSFSYDEFIARRSVRRWRDRTRFVRELSVEAARKLRLDAPADLVFIDADHSYAAVRDDFIAWRGHLRDGGAIAFHDSRPCDARRDLQPSDGPVRLIAEIADGRHGAWRPVETADSITVVRAAQAMG